ncbi:MAG TPA: polysaccharide deacetylase family protein, partial [Thermodesulfobacteriota bacterium]|nr:polysaccharide deacetylase family protein [Thermodesulfobacteriota bacterium]
YHHVNRHPGDLVTLSPEGFENHLRVIRDKKIRTVFLPEIVEMMQGRRPAAQEVALTFDDGHLDNWVYAFPLLKKYEMKATIFVITSWMGHGDPRPAWEPGMRGDPVEIPIHREVKKRAAAGDASVAISWEEARVMEESGHVDIQCHTHRHMNYFVENGRVVALDPGRKEELRSDLACSKGLIEKELGKKCAVLSWPWGKYDQEALSIAGELGFERMVTTEKGVNVPGSDPRAIRRIVAKSDSGSWFSQRVKIYSSRFLGTLYTRVSGRI